MAQIAKNLGFADEEMIPCIDAEDLVGCRRTEVNVLSEQGRRSRVSARQDCGGHCFDKQRLL